MLRGQGELLRLMDEIDLICDQLRIPYYLVGHLLQSARKDRKVRGYQASVAMTYEDFCLFRAYVEDKKSEDRSIEEPGAARKPGKLSFRYVNTKSLLMDLDRWDSVKQYGIYVDIMILQKKGRRGTLLSWMDHALKRGEIIASGPKHKYIRTIAEPIFRLLHKVAPARYGKTLYKYYTENAWPKGHGSAPALLSAEGRLISLPGNFSDGYHFVRVEGHSYRTIASPDTYLKNHYGENWKNDLSYAKETYMVPTNPKVSYEDFLKDPYLSNFDSAFFRRRDNWRKLKDDFLEHYDTKEKSGWNYLFATEARVNCWKKYMPMKKELLELWAEGRHDEVILKLKEYCDYVNEYMELGIAICFDEDIWSIYHQWLKENGQADVSKKLKKMVWPEHLKGIHTSEAEAWLAARMAM